MVVHENDADFLPAICDSVRAGVMGARPSPTIIHYCRKSGYCRKAGNGTELLQCARTIVEQIVASRLLPSLHVRAFHIQRLVASPAVLLCRALKSVERCRRHAIELIHVPARAHNGDNVIHRFLNHKSSSITVSRSGIWSEGDAGPEVFDYSPTLPHFEKRG